MHGLNSMTIPAITNLNLPRFLPEPVISFPPCFCLFLLCRTGSEACVFVRHIFFTLKAYPPITRDKQNKHVNDEKHFGYIAYSHHPANGFAHFSALSGGRYHIYCGRPCCPSAQNHYNGKRNSRRASYPYLRQLCFFGYFDIETARLISNAARKRYIKCAKPFRRTTARPRKVSKEADIPSKAVKTQRRM